ncbi:MAG: hypothetical protein AW09_001417 [Candidatus Accumulibacter phosphatis]|uniref:Uncharacterized protein n=1 Tax=Candidatus Accumulibacter phosphatis TaxID=327160 RepID=A0A080LXB9_9PROT|nr:MAG: hypothetical protein AW09_001417 [Candidatus Accumulibacter phosphatis]
MAATDQVFGELDHPVKVVGGKIQVALRVRRAFADRVFPGIAKPAYRIDDRIDVFLFFLFRIGIVETKVATTTEILCQSEIEADRFGMAEVQIAVGFWRKARADFRSVERAGKLLNGGTGTARPSARRVFTGSEIGFDEVADEIAAGECCWAHRLVFWLLAHDAILDSRRLAF